MTTEATTSRQQQQQQQHVHKMLLQGSNQAKTRNNTNQRHKKQQRVFTLNLPQPNGKQQNKQTTSLAQNAFIKKTKGNMTTEETQNNHI